METKKKKKIMISVIGGVVGLFILGNLAYYPINIAQNYDNTLYSAGSSIKDNIIYIKSTLIDAEASINELNKNKENPTELKLVIEEMEKVNFVDRSRLNDNIKLADRLNEELDKIISIYENDDDMKNNINLTNKMIEVDSMNRFVDELMERHNEEVEEYNKIIKKFPVSVVAKHNGWAEVDKFSSIDE